MKIELKKFGELLISRPAGHEAARVAAAYLKPPSVSETIELDFTGVAVLAPSWLDEFVQGLQATCSNPIEFGSSENASVKATIVCLRGE